jgi:hypothetical protein
MLGAGKLRDHNSGHYIHTQCLATSQYVDTEKDYSIDFRWYFKHDSLEAEKYGSSSKVQLTTQLVDESERMRWGWPPRTTVSTPGTCHSSQLDTQKNTGKHNGSLRSNPTGSSTHTMGRRRSGSGRRLCRGASSKMVQVQPDRRRGGKASIHGLTPDWYGRCTKRWMNYS